MLSFYEMNCLLEKANKSTKTVSEASDAMNRHLAAIAAAQSSAKPAELETPTPTQAAVAPQQAPANISVKSNEPPKSMGGTSPNEPGTAAHDDNFQKNVTDRGREGIRPSNHKAQPNQADNGNENFTENLAMFNNMLNSSSQGPSQRGLTAMAMADLKMPYQVPAGRFEIAANMSRGDYAKGKTDNIAELVMPVRDIIRLMKEVSKYSFDKKGGNGYKMGKSLKQVLSSSWDSADAPNSVILRALQFEKFFLSPDIVGKPMSITELGAILAKKAGPPSNFNGAEKVSVLADPQTASQNMDLEALNYILKIADKKGFGQFFNRDNSNPSDPKITVMSPSELGEKNHVMGRVADRVNSRFGSPAPKEECNQWMDMMDMLEHWNFKH